MDANGKFLIRNFDSLNNIIFGIGRDNDVFAEWRIDGIAVSTINENRALPQDFFQFGVVDDEVCMAVTEPAVLVAAFGYFKHARFGVGIHAAKALEAGADAKKWFIVGDCVIDDIFVELEPRTAAGSNNAIALL